MSHLFFRVILFSHLALLSACSGGGDSDGGNNSQTLAEARTISINIAHGDTATEAYTLEFTAVDAAASPYFTLYLWEPEILSNQATVTQAALEVHIYPDGGVGETCMPNWLNNMATCQFSISNASQLNLDITNNSGGDVAYMYIFMPGDTPVDGSAVSPFRILDSVIYDTYISVTAGIVGGVSGDSSYYVVNTGNSGTAFDSEIFAVAGGDQSALSIDLYSDSAYATAPVYSCADLSSLSCDTMFGLTANTDYYLKVTSNGSANPWIIYQLDLAPGNAIYIDNGININFSEFTYTYSGEAFSAYMFDSNGVAVAGLWAEDLWADIDAMPAGGATVKLKTLDANGCVTATDAPRIDTDFYTIVTGTKLESGGTTGPGTTSPAACASTSGYIRIATAGESKIVDMSTVSAFDSITMFPYEMTKLGINAVSGTTSDSLYCSVYDYNYTGADDKYRFGWAPLFAVNGDVSQSWIGINVPQGGAYRIRCFADMNNDGIENSGDSVFALPFYSNYVTSLQIDATTGWVAVP